MDNNTQTQVQISALRTLQESYDALADASSAQATATALESAKQAILTAIGALNNPSVADIQSGLAKETSVKDGNDTAIGMLKDNTNGLAAIKSAIPSVASIQSGLATSSALSSVATDASNAATDAAAAKAAAQAITGYATETNATSNKNDILQAISDNAGVPTLTIPDTTSSQELAPNTLYIFSSRDTALTLTLGTPITGIANEYHFFLITDSTTAPTITWPSGISWNGGSAPTIAADKTYEVSILNNVAVYLEI